MANTRPRAQDLLLWVENLCQLPTINLIHACRFIKTVRLAIKLNFLELGAYLNPQARDLTRLSIFSRKRFA